jgi:NhaP-type Na+/H+ or K+/H+ antiporter
VASKASGKIPRMATPPPKGVKAPSRLEENVYRLLMLAAVTVVGVGTVVYHWLEDWSWVDSLYFSVVTASTVGFGDLAPTKDSSKLFTIVYIVFAVSIIGTFLSVRFRARTTERAGKRSSKRDQE